jgi:hypothetical protein
MAAIQVTAANINGVTNGNRVVVRNSAGIPYVVVENYDNASIDVYMGNSATPTSFAEQDFTHNPDATTFGSVSAAIDSAGIIHIVYAEYISKSSDLEYVQFDTATNLFQNAVPINSDLGEEDTAITNIQTAIAVDLNNIPHILVSSAFKVGGSTQITVQYNNRINAFWNVSMIEIEGATAGKACDFPSIAIDLDNKPVISYTNNTDDDVGTGIGNLNDATSFTLYDVETDCEATSGTDLTSIAVDSSGNHYVAYRDEGDTYIYINKHTYGVAWTTWGTRQTDSKNGINPSLCIRGTDVYIFYEEDTAHDIVYDKYTGTWGSGSWGGEVTLETGTYNSVKANWCKYASFNASPTVVLSSPTDTQDITDDTPALVFTGTDTSTFVDYVFADQTVSYDIWWNSLTILGDEIEYNVQVDTVNTFTSPLLDKVSDTDDHTAWSGTGDPHPWPTGNTVIYTVQSALPDNDTYYWRVRGKDPLGSNVYGAWSIPTWSFDLATGGGGTSIKTINGLAKASCKTVNGLAIASVKTWNGLA